MRIGVLGCGMISAEYLRGARAFPDIDIVACSDAAEERARARADEFGISLVLAPDELLTGDHVDAVLNLTPPQSHYELTRAALLAGKHVYSEKPLAMSLDEGRRLVATADEMGVRLGCAPDTFLGGALQTCRKVVDDGWIGEPIAAAAFVPSHGYDYFHPSIDYLYAAGGGPILDVGPYYLTALVHMLGQAVRVSAATSRSGETREIPRPEEASRRIPVEVSTHVAGTVEFGSGAVASVIASWDVWSSHLPYLEIYGTEGSLSVPNPDLFDGVPRLLRPGLAELEDDPPRRSEGWKEMPLTHRGDVGRSIGLAEMASSLRAGVPHRASGQLALHVLEVLLAFETSSAEGRHVDLTTAVDRPEPLPTGLPGYPVLFQPR